jgi:hypothetical protein
LQKVVIGILISFLLTGCAVFRKSERSGKSARGMSRNEVSAADLLKNNLTSRNFFIQKAEIEISSEELREKFLASIRFAFPDTFNISVRTRTGIELARIFLTRDTVLANDRLNRVLYYGKPGILGRKYGISSDAIPVIFGDYVNGGNDTIIKCNEDKAGINGIVHGLRIHYDVDCKVMKVQRSVQQGNVWNSGNEIIYSDFMEIGDIVVPMLIRINKLNSKSSIEVKMGKIERPWTGSVRFVPGNRYDQIELK